MTVINVAAAISAVGGSRVVESGTVTVEYQRGADHRPAVRASGSEVILPAPVVVQIVNGAPVTPVDAPATDGTCYARVVVESRVPYIATPFVLPAVAIPATGPVPITALVAVDPASYEPVTTTVTAWQLAVDQVKAIQTDVTTKAGQASTAAATSETNAAGSAAAAQTARTGAETARMGAETARDAAAGSAASVAKGQPNGTASLDGAGRLPETQVPARLTSSNVAATLVAVRTSDGQALPPGTVVVITIDKTLAQVTASPVAEIADIRFQAGA